MKQRKNYKAVVIGASWGGLAAVVAITKDLPANYPLPIVVVLHRLKDFESELEAILQKKIALKVCEVDEKRPLKGGKMYVAPANYHVLIESDSTFSLSISAPENYSRPSIDVTFDSAAEAYGNRLIGIILTGANNDGSKGLKAIVDKGGTAIIQDPEEAEMNMMPLAAIALVNNALVLKLSQIKDFLLSVV